MNAAMPSSSPSTVQSTYSRGTVKPADMKEAWGKTREMEPAAMSTAAPRTRTFERSSSGKRGQGWNRQGKGDQKGKGCHGGIPSVSITDIPAPVQKLAEASRNNPEAPRNRSRGEPIPICIQLKRTSGLMSLEYSPYALVQGAGACHFALFRPRGVAAEERPGGRPRFPAHDLRDGLVCKPRLRAVVPGRRRQAPLFADLLYRCRARVPAAAPGDLAVSLAFRRMPAAGHRHALGSPGRRARAGRHERPARPGLDLGTGAAAFPVTRCTGTARPGGSSARTTSPSPLLPPRSSEAPCSARPVPSRAAGG